MNILGLISQLIGIKTLRLTLSNVPLYILKLRNLPLTAIFLLNTNITFTNYLKQPILTTYPNPPNLLTRI